MRPIDGDALIEILTTAIRNVQGVTKFIGAENDPEIKMAIKCYTDILDDVKEQPTIELEPHWIPCSERLPEGSSAWRTEYLATVYCAQWKKKTKTMCVDWGNATARGKTISRWTWNNRLFPKELEVIAWMPLPKPYESE